MAQRSVSPLDERSVRVRPSRRSPPGRAKASARLEAAGAPLEPSRTGARRDVGGENEREDSKRGRAAAPAAATRRSNLAAVRRCAGFAPAGACADRPRSRGARAGGTRSTRTPSGPFCGTARADATRSARVRSLLPLTGAARAGGSRSARIPFLLPLFGAGRSRRTGCARLPALLSRFRGGRFSGDGSGGATASCPLFRAVRASGSGSATRAPGRVQPPREARLRARETHPGDIQDAGVVCPPTCS